MCVRELILRIFDAKIELLLSIFRVLSIAQAIMLTCKENACGALLICSMVAGGGQCPFAQVLCNSLTGHWALPLTGDVTVMVAWTNNNYIFATSIHSKLSCYETIQKSVCIFNVFIVDGFVFEYR